MKKKHYMYAVLCCAVSFPSSFISITAFRQWKVEWQKKCLMKTKIEYKH